MIINVFMMNRVKLIHRWAVILLLLLFGPAHHQLFALADSLISVTKYTQTDLELTWNLKDLILDKNQNRTHIWFENARYSGEAGKPAIPFREFMIGVPDHGKIKWDLIIQESVDFTDLLPEAIEVPGHDINGVSQFDHSGDSISFDFLPGELIEISEKQYFRDLPVRRVKFYPLIYDHAVNQLRVIRQAKIRFYFENATSGPGSASIPDRLDRLYPHLILNHEQSKIWQLRRDKKLAKSRYQYEGPVYRMEVVRDGLYKISRSILVQAGIDVAGLDPKTIKIWNTGGQPLNVNTTSEENNPLGPVENAIYVAGEEDGSFDANDFILFYGTGAGGWNFNSTINDFVYVEHPYSTKNYYVLTYGGTAGKRMEIVSTPSSGATIADEFFLDRSHFEEDKYNLLNSGNDWYGYRFFGRNGSGSFTLKIDAQNGSTYPARFRIKLKSGNGIKWDDNKLYQYMFNIYLNPDNFPAPLFNDIVLYRRESRIWEKSFISSDYLQNGDNILAMNYTANLEECNAYLDWVEVFFPKPFIARNNFLMFYTNSRGQIVSYNISGFDQNNIIVLDVSKPTDVIQLNTGSIRSGSNYAFNLDLSDNIPRRIIVSSLNSSLITPIASLSRYHPSKNLLDPSIAAELIIITHQSFASYAQDLLNLRATDPDPVPGIVVTTSDIYFYFNSMVQDPVAIRNFIRYAYLNWSNPAPAYILLFGDGHFDFRNITLADTNRVPPFEISDDYELNARESDNFYVDVNFSSNNISNISPDLAVGRLPIESHLDARRMMEKLTNYKGNASQDGWQTVMTFVGDDEVSGKVTGEWIHQRQTESLASLPEIQKFLLKKVYLSAFNSVPGGFGRVKPEANKAIIDQLNEGTLLINYVGHGSPREWAHESVLNLTRDLNRIQNQGKLTFWIAATCDFGKYDDPRDPSFTEALIWQPDAGAIGVLSSSRLVFSGDNFAFNTRFLRNLFPSGGASRRLGEAMLLSSYSGANDQKYHLFADPSMYLTDPRSFVNITSVSPDTLKALSRVGVEASISPTKNGAVIENFDGGAFLIVNDARYDSVNTGGPDYYSLSGPRIFKGEVSVFDGLLSGNFIVPKSIRYKNKNNGRITVYAWDNNGTNQAMGYIDNLLFNGTETNLSDDSGPVIDIYFEGQERFNNGDIISKNPVLIAEISDESGINLTNEVGHSIEIKIDETQSQNITAFFAYDRDSYVNGKLTYHLENLNAGNHTLTLQAWDNLNNPNREIVEFRISEKTGLSIADVVNYPNPFTENTNFTFQLQGAAGFTEARIKIYTISGRLIATLDNLAPPQPGFNFYPWNARDDDGDSLANGVYLYKIIVHDGDEHKEVIEKMVILR